MDDSKNKNEKQSASKLEQQKENLTQEFTSKTAKIKNGAGWLYKNKTILLPVLLLLILVGVIFFYQVRLSTVESEFIIKKNNYEKTMYTTYQVKIDSLNRGNAFRLSKVFSWSVRAELMRGNNEQVSLLFGQFIKTPGIGKVFLIDPSSGEILISTDRKVEGETFTDFAKLKKPKASIENNELVLPVSGLNDVLALLYFKYDYDQSIPKDNLTTRNVDKDTL